MQRQASHWYQPIGEWLIHEKGCQNDRYSQGYLAGTDISGVNIDVLGIRYEVYEKNTASNSFLFHGYAVDIQAGEQEAFEYTRRIQEYMDAIGRGSRDWISGLDSIRFFIAYPGDFVSPQLADACQNAGIGVLLLQAVRGGRSRVMEALDSKEIILTGISRKAQHSNGQFEAAIRGRKYLYAVFRNAPGALYDDFIRPKIEEYYREKALERAIGCLHEQEAITAFKYIYARLRSQFPELRTEGRGKRNAETSVAFIPQGQEYPELVIEMCSQYFRFSFPEKEIYRVYAMDTVLQFAGGFWTPFGGTVENLMDDMVMPGLTAAQPGKVGVLDPVPNT